MKLRFLIVLACAALTLSACVVEPYGAPARHYGGGYHDHDYGRPVWRG
jgi:hypothetical protein